MEDPPFAEGAVQVTTDCAFAFEVADTEVGASGAEAGVTVTAVEATLSPFAFTALR